MPDDQRHRGVVTLVDREAGRKSPDSSGAILIATTRFLPELPQA